MAIQKAKVRGAASSNEGTLVFTEAVSGTLEGFHKALPLPDDGHIAPTDPTMTALLVLVSGECCSGATRSAKIRCYLAPTTLSESSVAVHAEAIGRAPHAGKPVRRQWEQRVAMAARVVGVDRRAVAHRAETARVGVARGTDMRAAARVPAAHLGSGFLF